MYFGLLISTFLTLFLFGAFSAIIVLMALFVVKPLLKAAIDWLNRH